MWKSKKELRGASPVFTCSVFRPVELWRREPPHSPPAQKHKTTHLLSDCLSAFWFTDEHVVLIKKSTALYSDIVKRIYTFMSDEDVWNHHSWMKSSESIFIWVLLKSSHGGVWEVSLQPEQSIRVKTCKLTRAQLRGANCHWREG